MDFNSFLKYKNLDFSKCIFCGNNVEPIRNEYSNSIEGFRCPNGLSHEKEIFWGWISPNWAFNIRFEDDRVYNKYIQLCYSVKLDQFRIINGKSFQNLFEGNYDDLERILMPYDGEHLLNKLKKILIFS